MSAAAQTGTCTFPTLEQIPDSERRAVFSVSAIGNNQIFENPIAGSVDVVEIQIFSVAANTVMVLRDVEQMSPAWDLAIRQSVTDPGFILFTQGAKVFLRLTVAAVVQGILFWRQRGCK